MKLRNDGRARDHQARQRATRRATACVVEGLEARRLLSASISGTVYNDANANHLRDAGETAVAGVQVYLDLQGIDKLVAGDPISTTDPSGAYAFTGLSAGNYLVRVAPANGRVTTTPIWGGKFFVPLGANQAIAGDDFGVQFTPSFSVFGQLLVAGSSNGSPNLTRYNQDETTDDDFGNTGTITLPAGVSGSPSNAFGDPNTGHTFVYYPSATVELSGSGGILSVVPIGQGVNSPTNLTASPNSATSVQLGFTDNSTNDTGFVIERSTSASGPFVSVGTLPGSLTGPSTGFVGFADNTAAPGTTYFYRVYATNGSTQSAPAGPVSVTTPGTGAETPFGGTPASIPGQVEAENFDNGGEGVAYHSTSSVNLGGQYRNTGVSIEATGDAGGGFDVGYTHAGDYLKYSISVAATGSYDLGIRVASPTAGAAFHVEVDGANVTGSLAIPVTASWQTYTLVTRTGINLTAGSHVIRLVMDANDRDGFAGNFNWFAFTPSGSVAAGGSISGTVFGDSNFDGIADFGDAPVAGRQVYLDLNGIGVFAAGDPVSITDANGHYSFTDLAPANYLVRLVPQVGSVISAPIFGGKYFVQLANNQAVVGDDFGTHDVSGEVQRTQSDGKLLVADVFPGSLGFNLSAQLTLRRFNPDGSLDVTYGQLGSVPLITAQFPSRLGASFIVLGPDGSALVGTSRVGGQLQSDDEQLFLISPAGQLVNSDIFTGGDVQTDSSKLTSAIFLPNGQILGIGSTQMGSGSRVLLRRYSSNLTVLSPTYTGGSLFGTPLSVSGQADGSIQVSFPDDLVTLSPTLAIDPARVIATPTGFTATALSPTSVQLQFNDNSANEQSFLITRSSDIFHSGPVMATLPGTRGTGVRTFTDTWAVAGRTYTYDVYAVNGAVRSLDAGTITVTTPTS